MDVSVIVVNWNTKELLLNCINSLVKFTKDINFEIIVVDNGSTDGSQEAVKKKFKDIKLIENKQNLGFAKANNQGIEIANGKYIFLLNSDAYLIENSLDKLIKEASNLKDLGAIGPKLLNEDKTIQQSVGFLPDVLKILLWMSFIDDLPYGQYLKPFHIDHDSFYKGNKEVGWVTGAAMFIPKSVVKKVGALDENIFMYGEEVEWCHRIKKAKFNVIFSDCTSIVHIGRGSSKKVSKNAFIGEYKGLKYFFKKNKSSLSLHVLSMLLKIGALARIIIFGLLGRKDLANAYVEAFKVA